MSIALVTAGGSGKRTGYAVPKQFLTVYEKPILIYTLENIQKVSSVDKIIVIIPEGWESFVESYCSLYSIGKVVSVINGGQNRFESVYNGLKEAGKFVKSSDEIVALCDGNRPLTPCNVFEEGVLKARTNDAVLTVDASFDSLYECDKSGEDDQMVVLKTLDRKRIYKGQSPEFARYCIWDDIYRAAAKDGLGDLTMSALCLHYGKNVVTINGSSKNFKITSSDDIELFKAFVASELQKK